MGLRVIPVVFLAHTGIVFDPHVLSSPLNCKEIKPVHPEENQSWIFIGRSDAETEAPLLWPPDVKNWHWKRPWYWERLKAGEEGDNRGGDGWMASQTLWTWVWASSRSCWWTGKPGVLQLHGVAKSWTWLSSLTELYCQGSKEYLKPLWALFSSSP